MPQANEQLQRAVVQQLLYAERRDRGLLGDRARHGPGLVQHRRRHAGHEPEARGLLRAELAPGERELTDEGVRAHKLWKPRLSISKIFDSRGSVIDLNFK